MRFGIFICLFFFQCAYSQDTLTIMGKIDNLSPRLYRQADVVRVSRINWLRGREEIVLLAPLQADGSFKLTLPLVFPTEECILNYSNEVTAPFLAQKGTVGITIFADLFGKTDVPFQFEGRNAATNNSHAAFEASLLKFMQRQKKYEDLYKKLSLKATDTAWEYLQELRELKQRYYEAYSNHLPTDPLLNEWVLLSLKEAAKAVYYEHLYYLGENAPVAFMDSLKMDTTALLTFSKANALGWFTRYALTNTKTKINSLQVEKLAKLLLQYSETLTETEREKLKTFSKNNEATEKDLQVLNAIFLRNRYELELYSSYELLIRQLGSVFDAEAINLLKGTVWAESCVGLSLKNMNKLYWHTRLQSSNSLIVKSLYELHQIENKDAVLVANLDKKHFEENVDNQIGRHWLEVAPKTYLFKSKNLSGDKLMDGIKAEFRGKKIYFIFSESVDEKTVNNLKESLVLRSIIPEEEMAFVYIFSTATDEQVWKETTIRQHLKGLHVQCSGTVQNLNVLGQFESIGSNPFCMLIDEKGKPLLNPAPQPTDRQGWTKLFKEWSK